MSELTSSMPRSRNDALKAERATLLGNTRGDEYPIDARYHNREFDGLWTSA